MTQNKYLRLGGIALLIVTLVLIFEFTGIRQQINIPFLRTAFEHNLITGTLIFVCAFTLGSFIQVPGWIFLASAVITLGKLEGGIVTYVAAIVACIITFLSIRFMGGAALREIESPIAKRLFSRIDSNPLSSMILLRICFQTLPLLNYSLALAGVKFRHYFLATLLGLPLPIALYCLFFDWIAKNLLALPV